MPQELVLSILEFQVHISRMIYLFGSFFIAKIMWHGSMILHSDEDGQSVNQINMGAFWWNSHGKLQFTQ